MAERGTSETPGSDEALRLLVMRKHLAIEAMPCFPPRWVPARERGQLLGGGANDDAPAVMDGDIEA